MKNYQDNEVFNSLPTGSSEQVTVVISTRNQGEKICATIDSILKNNYPNFSITIVDQSDSDITQKALGPYLSNLKVNYIRSATRGASAGRNVAIRSAKSEIIAITDDDCVVPENWISEIVRAFQADKKVALVFGNVLPAKHDPAAGFIPTYNISAPSLIKNLKGKNKVRGIFACSALKRSLWEEVNNFDPLLGTGAAFKSGEDFDYTVKILRAGSYIYQTPDIKVLHNGFRYHRQGKSHAYRSWYGIGATLAKHLKCGEPAILKIVFYEWVQITFCDLLRNLFIRKRLSGLTPIIGFGIGFLTGLLSPVDTVAGNFAGTFREPRLIPSLSRPDTRAVPEKSEGPGFEKEGDGIEVTEKTLAVSGVPR